MKCKALNRGERIAQSLEERTRRKRQECRVDSIKSCKYQHQKGIKGTEQLSPWLRGTYKKKGRQGELDGQISELLRPSHLEGKGDSWKKTGAQGEKTFRRNERQRPQREKS